MSARLRKNEAKTWTRENAWGAKEGAERRGGGNECEITEIARIFAPFLRVLAPEFRRKIPRFSVISHPRSSRQSPATALTRERRPGVGASSWNDGALAVVEGYRGGSDSPRRRRGRWRYSHKVRDYGEASSNDGEPETSGSPGEDSPYHARQTTARAIVAAAKKAVVAGNGDGSDATRRRRGRRRYTHKVRDYGGTQGTMSGHRRTITLPASRPVERAVPGNPLRPPRRHRPMSRPMAICVSKKV